MENCAQLSNFKERRSNDSTRRRNSVQSVRSLSISVIKVNFNDAESRVEIEGVAETLIPMNQRNIKVSGSEANSIRLINSSTTDRHHCETGEKTEGRGRFPDSIRFDRSTTYLCTISCCIHSLTLMWVSIVDPELCLDNFDRLPKLELLSYALSFFITSFRSGLLSLL